MQLSYRGTYYERQSNPLEVQEGEIAGKYRGQDWKYHYPRHIPQSPPKLYRQYRGVTYSTRPLSGEERTVYPLSSKENACSVVCPSPQPIIENQVSKIHLDNMRRNLERRLRIAEENGDEDLVTLLRKESEQLTV